MGDGTVRYTPATEGSAPVLTLNNAELNKADLYGCVIGAYEPLTLVLQGSNTIAAEEDGVTGVYACCGLTIQGSGSLTVQAAGDDSRGICSCGDLTITGGCAVSVTVGDAKGSEAYGICSENGSITIDESTVNVTAGPAGEASYGLYSELNDLARDGDTSHILIQGSTVTVCAGGCGIESDNGNISIREKSAVDVTVVGGVDDDGNDYGYGIWAYNNGNSSESTE